MNWINGVPKEAGYYLAALRMNDETPSYRIEKLWYNPDALPQWWYTIHDINVSKPIRTPVEYYMPLPPHPQKPNIDAQNAREHHMTPTNNFPCCTCRHFEPSEPPFVYGFCNHGPKKVLLNSCSGCESYEIVSESSPVMVVSEEIKHCDAGAGRDTEYDDLESLVESVEDPDARDRLRSSLENLKFPYENPEDA